MTVLTVLTVLGVRKRLFRIHQLLSCHTTTADQFTVRNLKQRVPLKQPVFCIHGVNPLAPVSFFYILFCSGV